MSVWSIVVAAGSGTRFGGPKQMAPLGGRRVLDWAVNAAAAVSDGVVVVVPADLLVVVREGLAATADGTPVSLAAGGATRSESVRAGLAAVPKDAQVIVVHDGARPTAEAALFGRAIAAVRDGAAVGVTVVPVTDTIRRVGEGTIDRSTLRAVQTPQAFWADSLRKAHEAEGDATDDASMVEALGGRVVLVDGASDNIKITNPVDLVIAEAILKSRSPVPISDPPSVEEKGEDAHA